MFVIFHKLSCLHFEYKIAKFMIDSKFKTIKFKIVIALHVREFVAKGSLPPYSPHLCWNHRLTPLSFLSEIKLGGITPLSFLPEIKLGGITPLSFLPEIK